jgi:antitoxin (DNA-binding transcriptional repressor) of toxin-antitoxin stability system
MRTVTIDEAKVRLEVLARHVQNTGESIGLTEAGEVIAVLRPPAYRLPHALTGRELAERIEDEGHPRMSPADAEAFARDVEEGIRFADRC